MAPPKPHSVDAAPLGRYETYIARRVGGEPTGQPFLDELQLYEVVEICLWLGSAELAGKLFAQEPPGVWTESQITNAGFEIASNGKDAVRGFLRRLALYMKPPGRPERGMYAAFGSIERRLTVKSKHGEHLMLRQMIVEIGHELTLHRFEDRTVLGLQIPPPRRLSLATASSHYGVHERYLRQALEALGIIGPESRSISDANLLIEFALNDARLRRIAGAKNLLSASVYLGVESETLNRLHMARHVAALVHRASAIGKPLKHFAKEELDALIKKVRGRARPFDGNVSKGAIPPEYAPLAASTMLVGRPISVVFSHLLGGNLRDIRFLHGSKNLGGVYLNVAELRAAVHVPNPDVIGAEKCAKMLQMSTSVLRQLTRLDPPLLPSRFGLNSVNLRQQISVSLTDANGFLETYISLSQIRSAASMHGTQIKAALAAEGILPVADPKQVGATYYLRAEVAASRFRIGLSAKGYTALAAEVPAPAASHMGI